MKEESVAKSSGGGWRGLPRSTDREERLCVTVPEAAKMLGVSRNFAYELVRQGKLPALELGKRKLIPRVALEKMLEKAGTVNSKSNGE
ncbi:helix-turn-helix domain-containing protein [Chloroflexota bacterium]